MSHRSHRLAALATTLCLSVAACGGSAGSDAESPPSSAEVDASAPISSASKDAAPDTTADTAVTTDATETDMATPPGMDLPEGELILTERALGGVVLSTGASFPFDQTDLDLEIPGVIGVFDDDRVVIVPVDLESESATGAVLFSADGEGEDGIVTADNASVSPIEIVGLGGVSGFDATGTIEIDGEPVEFALTIPVGMGTSTFELEENRAIVRGDLGTRAYQQVSYLIDEHPEVDTLVLQDISGSVNDDVNVLTGRLVREAGFTTYVPADAQIFSGGVDLFTSGLERIAEEGSEIGVHSWCCAPSGETADLLAQDDPAHDTQLAYFTEMLGEETGRAFYFFTLQAAPFTETDDMTPAERDYFNVVTADDTLADARDVSSDVAAVVGDTEFDTPSELADALAAGLSVDGATAEAVLTLDGEPSTIVVTVQTEGDDSILGEVITVVAEPDDSLGWAVASATSAATCERGVAEGSCV